MNAILKDLQGAGIVIPITSLFSSLIWPLQKSDGFWKMTVDHSRVNQVVILVVDVASFLECINIFSNTWYVATDPVIVFFFFPLPIRKEDQSSYSPGIDESIHLQSCPGLLTFPPSHNLV